MLNYYEETDEEILVDVLPLVNDKDPEEDLLQLRFVSNPSIGTRTVDPDENVVTYTPGEHVHIL